MHLEKNNEVIQNTRSSFFGIIKKNEELDESTFDVWKSELKKDLPTFWEEVNNHRVK